MTIRSEQFDDIYFSPEDGAAETEYVFLKGNNLPNEWKDAPYYSICETGFGTGLNFLLAWELFEKTAKADQQLHFISFEKYPLKPEVIKDALSPWAERFSDKIEQLCKLYPLRVSGWHRLYITPQITLTLIFDDINNAAPELDPPINAWFLDGFAPSKNPDMWSDALFSTMQRCAIQGTRVSTFTAAGLVKRGLTDHGFTVTKQAGFGRKREMITAKYETETKRTKITPKHKQNIAIIGGGLGGCAAAYHLNQAGHNVTLFEKEDAIAKRASGNMRGLYNPRFRKYLDAESYFYSTAYAYAHQIFRNCPNDIDFTPCGALHLITNEQKQDRLSTLLDTWNWHEDHISWVNKENTESICDIPLSSDALHLPDSGYVSPPKLCRYLSKDIEIKTCADLPSFDAYDAVILATGADFKDFSELDDIALNTVRGQITVLNQDKTALPLTKVLCYGGYTTPAHDNTLICGSSFQRWRHDEENDPADNDDNIAKLNDILPEAHKLSAPDVTGARTALRTASKDHFPAIGHLKDNIYVSTAHGSHGLLSSLTGAVVLSDLITYGQSISLPQSSLKKLSPHRFNKQ